MFLIGFFLGSFSLLLLKRNAGVKSERHQIEAIKRSTTNSPFKSLVARDAAHDFEKLSVGISAQARNQAVETENEGRNGEDVSEKQLRIRELGAKEERQHEAAQQSGPKDGEEGGPSARSYLHGAKALLLVNAVPQNASDHLFFEMVQRGKHRAESSQLTVRGVHRSPAPIQLRHCL